MTAPSASSSSMRRRPNWWACSMAGSPMRA
jgi:hypothetical protein